MVFIILIAALIITWLIYKHYRDNQVIVFLCVTMYEMKVSDSKNSAEISESLIMICPKIFLLYTRNYLMQIEKCLKKYL